MQIIDLDKIQAQDKKGLTAYSAIAAKLRSVRMPSLAATAASVALPMSMSATQLPDVGPASDIRTHETYTDNRPQTVQIEKIEIHIANADGQGRDEIRTMVQNEILEALNTV